MADEGQPATTGCQEFGDGVCFRSPVFNLPITKLDSRWTLLTHIARDWFSTQEPFNEKRRCRFLEIGVWQGGNAPAFFEAFGPIFDYVGVDPYGELVDDPYLGEGKFWKSSEEANEVYEHARRRFEICGAHLHRMPSNAFFAGDAGLFDIIFVDGDHRFPQALKDLNAGLDHLRPGGLLLCDDVGNSFHPEVEWAARRFYDDRRKDIAAYGGHPLFFQMAGMPFPVMLMIATFQKREQASKAGASD